MDPYQVAISQYKQIKQRLLIKSSAAEEAELRFRLIDLRFKLKSSKTNIK